MARVRALTGRTEHRLHRWEMALAAAGACAGPAEAQRLGDWIAAVAPGTAAQALVAAGRCSADAVPPLHDRDVWWRTEVPAGGERTLVCDGLATFAEAWLDGDFLFSSRSMFQPVEARLAPSGPGILWICFRALAPALRAKGPRARWRPRMIEGQGLRLVRTTLLGHMPGWQPAVDVVGPWREVRVVGEGPVRLGAVSLQAALDADGPRLIAEVAATGAASPPVLRCAGAAAPMEPAGEGRFRLELRARGAEPWAPHTHGAPALHPVTLEFGEVIADLGRTGFRRVELDRGADGQGFGLRINGTPVFCRGASWVHPDPVGLGGGREVYEPSLRLMRQAGMNMVRVSGIGVYESPEFFVLCDELGLMVWQDFMFANFDYPVADPAFLDAARSEAEAALAQIQASPSLAVLCGGSEVMQQATMMGLAPGELDWPLFDGVLPKVAGRLRPDVAYVPNTPFGGALPFEAGRGVTHYYGVGAYERPLEDARRAEVRFAAECLAFANVPAAESLADAAFSVPAVHDPRWKARVPRDRGASWDFEDTREHYFAQAFGLNPAKVRREDPDLYLDLSRAVTGEVMAAVFAEWRRARSSCQGGLVWLLRDGEIGAGWGLIDGAGRPKPCWWALRRVLQPRQVLITDEGVNGLALHLINESAQPLAAELRLAVHGAQTPGPLLEVRAPVELSPAGAIERSAFQLLGRFFDFSYAYRFGPRAHAAVSAQLVAADGGLVSEAIWLPPGVRGWEGEGAVEAEVFEDARGFGLRLRSERLLRFVHLADPHFRPDDDWFTLLPGEPRVVRLAPAPETPPTARPDGELRSPGGAVVGSYWG
jgi:beta-mannosidase